MKPIVTALGICALLFGAQTANAIDWEGDDGFNPSHWSVDANWNGGSMPNCNNDDDATIATMTTSWPELDGEVDRGARDVIMRNAAQLNTNANELRVTRKFQVENGTGAASVTINGGGSIKAAQVRIVGGANGSTLTVSGAGTEVYTAATVSCP